MVQFKVLHSVTIALAYGKFIEVSIRHGSKAEFMHISSGELYLDGDEVRKRYKGYVTVPFGVRNPEGQYAYPFQLSEAIINVCNAWRDRTEEEEQVMREKAVEPRKRPSKGKTKSKARSMTARP
jgi:hypothetical protein